MTRNKMNFKNRYVELLSILHVSCTSRFIKENIVHAFPSPYIFYVISTTNYEYFELIFVQTSNQ